MIAQLPKSWNEITVNQFIEISNLKSEDFDSDTELLLEKLSILLDISIDDDLLNLDVEELFEILNSIAWINKFPINNHKPEINNYSLKDLNNLVLGEFIDLEHFMCNYNENLHIITAILYKQTKEDEWGNKIEEPYMYNVYKRSELFLNEPITSVLGIIDLYIKWRSSFLEANEGLFNDPLANVIEDEDQLDQDVLSDIKAEIAKEEQLIKFSWESILWKLSDGDVTKYKELFDTSLILIFNTLGMIKTIQPE